VRLLVTRPQDDAAGTAAELRARGHDVLLAPLLRVEFLPAALGAGPWCAVLLSSANGARAVAAHVERDRMTPLPAFTVGRTSAVAARAAGFARVESANGDTGDLVALAAARLAGSTLPILYMAGEARSADIAGMLAAHGLTVHTIVGYRAVSPRALPAEIVAALSAGTAGVAGSTGRLDGVLHYSPRSAATFLALVKAAGLVDPALNCFHYCLSQRVAAPLAAAGAARLRVAPRPEEAALLVLISH
jgi:uroporphyrinogen-III synthase